MSLTIDQWTDTKPSPARAPLLAEMQQAGADALNQTDPLRQAFYTGLFTGYAVGFGLVTREALDRARLQPGAVNQHIDVRRPRHDDDPDTLWACGVRHGFYLGTSERQDAYDCDLCGERLTDDDEIDLCEHGRFCGTGCIQDWHFPGGGWGRCTYVDGQIEDGA